MTDPYSELYPVEVWECDECAAAVQEPVEVPVHGVDRWVCADCAEEHAAEAAEEG